jgi:hypothetical protein
MHSQHGVQSCQLQNAKLRVVSRSFAKLVPPLGVRSTTLPSWVDEPRGSKPQLAIHSFGEPFIPGLIVDQADPIRRLPAWQSLGNGPGDADEAGLETFPRYLDLAKAAR